MKHHNFAIHTLQTLKTSILEVLVRYLLMANDLCWWCPWLQGLQSFWFVDEGISLGILAFHWLLPTYCYTTNYVQVKTVRKQCLPQPAVGGYVKAFRVLETSYFGRTWIQSLCIGRFLTLHEYYYFHMLFLQLGSQAAIHLAVSTSTNIFLYCCPASADRPLFVDTLPYWGRPDPNHLLASFAATYFSSGWSVSSAGFGLL